MLNTPAFGEFVKEARGARSQADLADKADTFRQRFGQIESGQPHDLTDSALAQLDAAFEWPTDFAESALRATLNDEHPVTYKPYEASDWDPCRLGYFADGSVLISVNRIASTAPAAAFFPMIVAARRTTLIDIRALDDDERLALGRLAGQWSGITNDSGRAVCTVAAHPDSGDHRWTPVAIDPLPGITSLSQALTLTRRLRPIIGRSFAADDDMAVALTLLAAAIDLGDTPDKLDTPNGIALLARPHGPSTASWSRLLEIAGLPPHRYRQADLTRVFRGLFDARDALIDIAYDPGAPTPISMIRQPEVVAAQDLSGSLLLFDSHLTPELPVVVHAALAAAGHPLPIVISTEVASLLSDDFTGLAIDINNIATPLPTDPGWLRQWRTGDLPYATITNYNSTTRRAVYTEHGLSHGIDLPNPYPVSVPAGTMP